MATLLFDDFSGGLNDTAASDSLALNSAQIMRNFNLIWGPTGKASLQKASGSSKLNSAAFNSGAAWTALTQFRLPTTKFLVGICGDKIAKMDDSDGTWDDISAALTITPNSGNNLYTTTEMKALKIFSNGVDATIKWSGSGNAAVLAGSPPTARSVLHVNNHLCHARDSTNTRRVQFSDLNDPEAYTSTHFFDMSTEPTALAALGNNLYIFELYKVSRVPIIVWPFSREEVIQDVGCVGPRALVNVDGATIVFMSPTGKFYSFDGSALNDISSGLIENEIAGMNKARMQYVTMDHYQKRRQIWISYSAGSSTTHNRILIYDYTRGINDGAWYIRTDIAANVLASVIEQRSSGEGDEVMFTGDYAGFVRQQDTGTSNDESTNNVIDALWVSGWQDLGDMTLAKNTRYVSVSADEDGTAHNFVFKVGFDGENGFSINKSINLSTGGAVFGTAIFGTDVFAGGAFFPFFEDIGDVGKFIKFGISSANANEKLSLLRKFQVQYDVLGQKEKVLV